MKTSNRTHITFAAKATPIALFLVGYVAFAFTYGFQGADVVKVAVIGALLALVSGFAFATGYKSWRDDIRHEQWVKRITTA